MRQHTDKPLDIRAVKKHKKLQKKKFGAKNITVIGHSHGGLLAQMLGKNSKEIIVLNKATRPQEMLYGSSKKNKQFDVRSQGDVVSMFRNLFQKSKQKDITIKNKTGNPLQEHSVDILERPGSKTGNRGTHENRRLRVCAPRGHDQVNVCYYF